MRNNLFLIICYPLYIYLVYMYRQDYKKVLRSYKLNFAHKAECTNSAIDHMNNTGPTAKVILSLVHIMMYLFTYYMYTLFSSL